MMLPIRTVESKGETDFGLGQYKLWNDNFEKTGITEGPFQGPTQ